MLRLFGYVERQKNKMDQKIKELNILWMNKMGQKLFRGIGRRVEYVDKYMIMNKENENNSS